MLATFRQQMADYVRGEELVALREARHLTQEKAAHEIGTTAKSLRSWEKGGTIRWENAKKLAAFYKVDAHTLVTREPTDTPNVLDSLNGKSQLDRIEEKLDELLRRREQDRPGEGAIPTEVPPDPASQPEPRGGDAARRAAS